MPERITAWQCIGCGRIEAPQQCVGICSDRRVELANAADLDAALADLAQARRAVEQLAAVARQIANTTPRKGQCERTWQALQRRARQALDALEAPARKPAA